MVNNSTIVSNLFAPTISDTSDPNSILNYLSRVYQTIREVRVNVNNNSVNQSISNNTATTVAYSTIVWDTVSGYSTTNNNYKAKVTGRYLIFGLSTLNKTSSPYTMITVPGGASSGAGSITVNTTTGLTIGDVVLLLYSTGSSSAVTINAINSSTKVVGFTSTITGNISAGIPILDINMTPFLSSSASFTLNINKNSSSIWSDSVPITTTNPSIPFITLVTLNVGDIISMQVTQTTGSTQTLLGNPINNFLEITRI